MKVAAAAAMILSQPAGSPPQKGAQNAAVKAAQLQSGHMTLILSNDDIEKLLPMPDCIDALEQAYVELAEGRDISRRRSDSIEPRIASRT